VELAGRGEDLDHDSFPFAKAARGKGFCSMARACPHGRCHRELPRVDAGLELS
jgi:hypothetical protein